MRTYKCEEAHTLLRLVPLRKSFGEMNEDEIATINHYIYCKDCRDRGLADILETKISCREAILVWAKHAGALWLACPPTLALRIETLMELYATEHVWGKYQWNNSTGGSSWDTLTACREFSCRVLHSYWASIPMSTSAGDGPKGVIQLFPLLFSIFVEAGWPLDELLSIQKERIAKLLNDINTGKITVSIGHYHSVDELMAEMKEHVAILQKLAIKFSLQVVRE